MSLRFWLGLLRPLPRMSDPVEHVGDPDDTPDPMDGPQGDGGHPAVDPFDSPCVRGEHARCAMCDQCPQNCHPEGLSVEVAGRGGPAPARLAAEDQAAIVERLDVEPERRPWDRACIDGQPDRRCDAGDVLTDLIGAQKDLERRIADLEKQVAELRAAADHIKHETRERQS